MVELAKQLSRILQVMLSLMAPITLTGCALGGIAAMATDAAIRPDPRKTIPVSEEFRVLCAKDGGLTIFRKVSGEHGFLHLPRIAVDEDGNEQDISYSLSFRSYALTFRYDFSDKNAERYFQNYAPMRADGTPFAFIETINPKYDVRYPQRRYGAPLREDYFEGFVAKRRAERPSTQCDEHDRVFPLAQRGNPQYCISYERSTTPQARIARQVTVLDLGTGPGAASGSQARIKREEVRFFEYATDQTIAQMVQYFYIVPYTHHSIAYAKMFQERWRTGASCGGVNSTIAPILAADEWNPDVELRLMGIGAE